MPLDPSILAQGKPFQTPDPLQNYAKVLQIQGAQQQLQNAGIQQQVSQMQLEEMQRDREEMQKIQQERIAQGQDPDLRKLAASMMNTKQYFKDGVELLQKLDGQDKLNAIMGGGATNALAPAGAAPAAPTNALASGVAPAAVAAPANALAKTALPAPGMRGGMPGGMPEAAPLGTPVRTAPATPMGATMGATMGASVSTQAQETLGKINQLYALGTPQAVSIAKGLEAQMKFLESRVPLPADVEEQKARLARAGAPSVINVGEKAEAGAFGKMLVDQYGDISKAAGLAVKTLPSIESNLGALNKGLDTGFGTEAKAAGAKVLGALGVKDAEKYATDTQTFQSNAINAVLQKQLEQKGPQTESDAQRIEQTGAQLGKTKDANQFILSVAKEQLKRDIDQSNFYRQWHEKTGSFNGAESAWFNGEGGKSLFDRPALKKYAVSSNVATQPAPSGNRPSLDTIFSPKR
jgi:hypothetical protein